MQKYFIGIYVLLLSACSMTPTKKIVLPSSAPQYSSKSYISYGLKKFEIISVGNFHGYIDIEVEKLNISDGKYTMMFSINMGEYFVNGVTDVDYQNKAPYISTNANIYFSATRILKANGIQPIFWSYLQPS